MSAAALLLRCESGGGWSVYVDGVLVARILPGETLVLPVQPGVHTLRLGDGWRRSREVSVSVLAGREARFVCRRVIDDPSPDTERPTLVPVIGDIEGLYLAAQWLGTVAWHHNWIVVEPEELPSRPAWAIELCTMSARRPGCPARSCNA
jgi:hypothetical protein